MSFGAATDFHGHNENWVDPGVAPEAPLLCRKHNRLAPAPPIVLRNDDTLPSARFGDTGQRLLLARVPHLAGYRTKINIHGCRSLRPLQIESDRYPQYAE